MPRDERFTAEADRASRAGRADPRPATARSPCAAAAAGGRPGEITAVDGVDLDIALGEALAIVGESGSGKSTLLRIVAGLGAADVRSRSTLTGTGGPQMVFQDAGSSLTPWLSIGETLGERLRRLKLSRAEVTRPRDRRRWPRSICLPRSPRPAPVSCPAGSGNASAWPAPR